jgi:hypothetical protein
LSSINNADFQPDPITQRKHFTEKEQFMSNRVLSRAGARELKPEEVEHIAGGTTGCTGTSLHKNGPIVDVRCDPIGE